MPMLIRTEMDKLPLDFYQNPDTVQLAKDLLGKALFTKNEEGITSGIITETEAYCGIADKACHAYGNRRTARTEVMYKAGGVAYIYLCYGIHYLFNVVSNVVGDPHAVLIRELEPSLGVDIMKIRRGICDVNQLCNGPGKLTKAMGLGKKQNGLSLLGDQVWIENTKLKPVFISSARIGVGYAGNDALLQYRFFCKAASSNVSIGQIEAPLKESSEERL
jgi:DNA-3-methyladenine glycosylase